MNIKKSLLKEHSKTLTIKIVRYIGSNSKRYEELIHLFLDQDAVISQRAAWPLSYVSIEQTQLAYNYLDKLIFKFNQPNNHASITRNLLRIFEVLDIPDNYKTAVLNTCINLMLSSDSPIAVKAFSITVVTKICKNYPELITELKLHFATMQTNPISPAVRVRIKRALKELS
jgi:hypothetical protein